MTYFPPVSEKEIKKAENSFFIFLIIVMFFLIILTVSMFSEFCQVFWKGNKIWSMGGFATFVSVLHIRFFDIKKKSNKRNRMFSTEKCNPLFQKCEKAINLSWIVGFILMALSRWITY